MKNNFRLMLLGLLISCVFVSGCGLLWFGAGAATGAAVTKDAQDGKVIDD